MLGFFSGPLPEARFVRHARAIHAYAFGPADGAIQLKGLALLAGRKLLLADDSATIQKVIDLTFADEGVRVVTFGNGQDAKRSAREAVAETENRQSLLVE